MEDSDLVVNWRGERSRGWGGWAEKGGEVEETFRFVCPNNPAVREKAAAVGSANCLPGMNSPAFSSTRSAFPRPPTAWMKCCPVFAAIVETRRRA